MVLPKLHWYCRSDPEWQELGGVKIWNHAALICSRPLEWIELLTKSCHRVSVERSTWESGARTVSANEVFPETKSNLLKDQLQPDPNIWGNPLWQLVHQCKQSLSQPVQLFSFQRAGQGVQAWYCGALWEWFQGGRDGGVRQAQPWWIPSSCCWWLVFHLGVLAGLF